jgi:hypothetical protein
MQVTQICLKMSKMLSFQKEGIYVLSTLQFFHMFSPQQDYHLSASKHMHMHTHVHTPTHCEFPLYNYKQNDNITNTSLVTANLLKATAHFIYTKMNEQTTKYLTLLHELMLHCIPHNNVSNK